MKPIKQIYMAGPFFTEAQRAWNVDIKDRIFSYGYQVWLPQENEPRNRTSEEIFHTDITGIAWSDTIIATMDGADPDSGTCWEVGYVCGLNRMVPSFERRNIINLRTDFRINDDPDLAPYNIMLYESADRVFYTSDDLIHWLGHTRYGT